MTARLDSFTRDEVTTRGFEARCVTENHVQYLWHLGYGLRADPRDRSTTLILDPASLPEGPWVPTRLGAKELLDPSLLDLL